MIGYILILISLVILVFLVINNINTNKVEKHVMGIVGSINKKYEHRITAAKEEAYIKNTKKHKIDYFDDLVLRTKIRDKIPFFTGEILIIISIVSAIVFFISVNSISKNVVLKFEAGILGFMIPGLIMQQMSINVFDSIDDKILLFIDTAINFSTIRNELLFILENTVEYLSGPLKSVISQLVNELKRGVPTKVAFQNADNKVDNIKLKELFKNLYIVSLKDADYKGVLETARNGHEKFYEQKMKGKRRVSEGKKGLIILIVVVFFIFIGLNGFSSNLIGILEDTIQGNLLVNYFGLISIIIVNKYFKLNKFNV